MTGASHTTKRWLGGGLAAAFIVGVVSIGLFATFHSVRAQAINPEAIKAAAQAAAAAAEGGCLQTGIAPSVCPQKGINKTLGVISDKILNPAFRIALIQALLNLSQFVLDRLAYEAAVAIASGGQGEESLFYEQEPADAFKQLGLEVAGEAVGLIQNLSSEELGLKFNICDPSLAGSGANVSLSLALGIKQKYQPGKPKCDILKVGKNWEGFVTNIYQSFTDPQVLQDRVLSTFAQTLQPGKNELSAALRLNIAVDQEVQEQKLLQLFQRNEREFKPVKDFFTGNIKTPSQTLQGKFEKALENSTKTGEQIRVGELANAGELIGGLALSTASTFTNVLLSQLLDRVYTGLFDPPKREINVFDLEALGRGDKKSAQERFASVIATNPIATTPYNALAEFAVCAAGGFTNRGLNDCVMDVNFLAAVSRGNAGAGVTVQEAIDEGLLNADWPLISPDNLSANQDPFCYTYGYCYGNLVKLRKARVLPVGWELAALRNSASQPATLQDVINGFNDCTQDGTIGPAGAGDSSSKWCHLIDPNWVLKYPETQCRAVGSGEIRISSQTPGRTSQCVDAPSCIGEDNDGNCTDGYGYCVQEKNVWRFRGDECPSQYATCLSFENARTSEDGDFLVNTVDYSVCDQQNAGCRWYRTNKSFDDHATPSNTSDDSYEWLPEGDTYITAAHDTEFGDRLYLTDDATSCAASAAGCTQLFAFSSALTLNSVRNPSFELDENDDGAPDGWVVLGGAPTIETSVANYGSASVLLGAGVAVQLEQFVDVSDRNFYTFSTYFRGTGNNAIGLAWLTLLDANGENVDAAGTSSSGDCTWESSLDLYLINTGALPETEFERKECTFTIPAGTQQVRIVLGTPSSATSDVYVDAVQLELGEDATFFTEGYSQSPTPAYYKVAPDYLGCAGSPNDAAECDSYALTCTAQDVGCNLYTPRDGDPSVPAIISSLDACPSECVGYTTYKQEATAYESDAFPLYFIADSASACAAQYVGCDAYTNLASAAEGGEAVEHYTDLRFCLTPTIADSSSTAVTPSTYFTWEGSDNAGYQLQTWYLLDSNYTGPIKTFQNSGYTETDPERAPCTHILMTGLDDVVCQDTPSLMDTDVWNNAACDEHADIFDNPDCREFFDTQGNIHYRQYSDTISISDECTAYRKDESTACDCQGNSSSECPIATYGFQEGSGGYWSDQGFCRYYVLPEESTECPAEQNGCREYTGGAGRNASTILTENFEEGTYEDFVMADVGATPTTISISNESVATEGHSLFVVAPASGEAGIDTVQISNSTVYDEDTAGTCGGTAGDAGCALANDIDGDGSDDEDCIVQDGESSCGALAGSLVGGKTFVLEFWAKGSAALTVLFVEDGGAGDEHNFADPNNVPSIPDTLALTGAWQLYSLGPIDTSTSPFVDFDETAVLRFTTPAGGQFYLDNIALKQVEENITLIKDSWVVPSTCDVSPSGSSSPQYYLGCEAYTDQRGNGVELYQFSDVCSEEVVGCQGFYQTANSESPYKEIYNARCVYSTDAIGDNDLAPTNTACTVDDVTYCTIATGQGYCTFDVQGTFPSLLPVDTSGSENFAIVYGPEAVEVAGDTPVYIVADKSFACSASAMGCEELGNPKFVQDQSQVESFASVTYLNRPADYGSILCEQEALFCEEWKSTQDGNFYFKDPLDKECEYKTGVVIENRPYFGWFRAGSQLPCDWEDTNLSGSFEIGADAAYLIAGEQYGAWRNGDSSYDGWVASCESRYDLCTEFVDVVDTGAGSGGAGKSYYFTNNDLLSEEQLLDSQRCNGQVSQKFGCALFNNTTVSELLYNAGASYLASVHADVFYGSEENSLVDPVSCTVDDGGVFTISAADAAIAGIVGTEVDLCQRRCAYTVDIEDTITGSSVQPYTTLTDSSTPMNHFYERSCLTSMDCPALTAASGEEASGTCQNVITGSAISYALSDDTNEILKVNRDRSCASWLACESSRTSWNAGTNMYDTICDSINLCVEGKQQGDRALCSDWNQGDPEVLSAYKYSSRDVNWTGSEYSGLAVPNQLPVQYYDQFNVEARAVCVYGGSDVDEDNLDEAGNPLPLIGEIPSEVGANGLPMACGAFEDCGTSPDSSCTQDSDCTSNEYAACDEASHKCYYACENVTDTDYRLVYNAGPCDSTEETEEGDGNGGLCTVGHCEDTGVACADNGDCAGAPDVCVVGYLQATGSTDCGNADCSCNPSLNGDNGINTSCAFSFSSTSIPTQRCDPAQFVCVDEFITADNENRDACVTNTPSRTCIPSSTSTVGSCFNDRCLADIIDQNSDGKADRLVVATAREQACRAYPEIDSPYPVSVVSKWKTFTGGAIAPDGSEPNSTVAVTDDESPSQPWSVPYTFVEGFKDSKVCGLDADGNPVDCSCSYDKIEFGSGTDHRYYAVGTGVEGLLENQEGVCSGGPFAGIPCQNDNDCSLPGTPDEPSTATGTCSFATRADTLYGWPGYCIERDTSIQTLGSTATSDQACLTWLPVDQLSGATDLYGKYTTAGFAPQNTYYCAEVDLGYTIGTSGIACAETQDNDCNSAGSGIPEKWVNFRNEADNSRRGQDDGIAGVWCPDAFFAVMTGCGSLDQALENGPYCTSGAGDSDSPYFCVPKFAYKMQDDGGGNPGDACVSPGGLDDYEGTFAVPLADEDDDALVEARISSSGKSDYYIDLADMTGATDETGDTVGNHFAGNDRPDIRVYVVRPAIFDTLRAFYDDCVVRGVVENANEYAQSEYQSIDTVDELVSRPVGDDGVCADDAPWLCGFRGLSHNFTPEAVCSSVVQVSSKTLSDEDNGIFQSYNAAWTNRLWSGQSPPPPPEPFALQGADIEHLGYLFSTPNEPYGSAIDYRNIVLETDQYPHQLALCTAADGSQALPTVGLTCDDPLYDPPPNSDDARANRSVSISSGLDVPTESCENDACSCESDASCNWDTGSDQAYACVAGGTFCLNDDNDGDPVPCTFDDTNDDGIPDDCEDYGGQCVFETPGVCDSGPNATQECMGDEACWNNECSGSSCAVSGSATDYILSAGSTQSAVDRLSQIFGRIYGVVEYSDQYEILASVEGSVPLTTGDFSDLEEENFFADLNEENYADYDPFSSFDSAFAPWIWDSRATRDNAQDHAPKVISVGNCQGTECEEGVEGRFSLNETDSGTLEGEGAKRVTLSFFAYADSEQMPIRRIVVDWGDDFTALTGDLPWPTGSQSGSTAPNNFYRNHRGINPNSNQDICSNDPDEFGKTPQACSSSYISFTHDYVCSPGRLAQLIAAPDPAFGDKQCEHSSDGRLLNSPCYDGQFCVFQPRVHVLDNWGWCTGFCDAGEDGTQGCYSGVTDVENDIDQNECNIAFCPSEGASESCEDSSTTTINPWINFDGTIRILAE